MRVSNWILVLAFVLVGNRPVFGQISSGLEHYQWEVSGFGGSASESTMDFATLVRTTAGDTSRTVGMEYESGYQAGVRLTDNFASFWAADLEYSFANQPLRFTNISPTVQDISLTHNIHDLSYSILFLPLSERSRIRPYVKAGLGGTLFYIHGASKREAESLGLTLQDSWKATLNVGGGVKFLVSEQFAVMFDVKDFISDIPSYGLASSARITNGVFEPGLAKDGMLQRWGLNIGFAYQWDE